MKKFLISIFSIVLWFFWFSYCSAVSSWIFLETLPVWADIRTYNNYNYDVVCFIPQNCPADSLIFWVVYGSDAYSLWWVWSLPWRVCTIEWYIVYFSPTSDPNCSLDIYWYNFYHNQDITVYYNNWNSSTDITCDWTQAIEINWLSTITSTNTFTPYYNISYKDEDNQSLVESYSKDILYLENWQFKKTYTWENDWILTVQWNSDPWENVYLPVFEVTWTINTDTWNVFNNFTDNALTVLLSNIPSYVQWITLVAVLLLLVSFVRRFRRWK